MLDSESDMKFALFIATILLAQNIISATERDSADFDEIMPDQVAPVGEFSVSFTLTELIGSESAHRYQDTVPADEPIEWELYVPDGYSEDRPAGVLAYISPRQTGEIPSQWKSLMEKHNLIWIGANESGNRVMVPKRMIYAVMGLAAIDKSYQIDVDRVYLAGFSGGGKAASVASAQYPQIFKGAIFICGARFWGMETPERIDQVKTNRYVFMTGTYDHNLELTRRVFKEYRSAGILNSNLLIVRNMTHENPKRRELEKAIVFLDSKNSGE
jgi:hypothetical protein